MKHAAILLIFISLSSFANMVGNDTQNFNPSTSGLDFITVQSSSTLSPGLINVGLFVDYAKNSLPDVRDEFNNLIDSDDSVIFSDFMIGYGLSERTAIGLSVSTIHDQQTNRTTPGAQFASTGLNEIRLSGKYNFLNADKFGMAAMYSTNFNQVRNNPFLGENSDPTHNLQLIGDYDFSKFKLALNFGYRFRSPGSRIPQSYYKPLGDQYIASAGASYYWPNLDLKSIFEIYASRLVKSVNAYEVDDISAEALIGFKYDQNTYWSWTTGVGLPVSRGLFTPDYRVFAGVTCTFDTTSASKSTAPEAKPPPPTKPTQIVRTTVISKYGYQPEDIEKLRNVPFDEMMQNKEFILKTAVELNSSEKDKPPFEVIRLEGFDFDFASNAIRPEYNKMFEHVASYLNSQPSIIKMRVEGHTDSVGSVDRNRIRSQQRADAVATFLRQKGVNKNIEIDSVGYGSDRPVADNGNFQGRKKNRRVEIRILRQISPLINESTQ